MGNCLVTNSNKVLAEDVEEQEPKMELAPKEFDNVRDAKKKNRVSFQLQEEDRNRNRNRDRCGEDYSKKSKSGVVRIKMVVTQEELKQILDYKKSESKFTSFEQLLREMRIRRTSVFRVEKCDGNGWSPALESIPEDH